MQSNFVLYVYVRITHQRKRNHQHKEIDRKIWISKINRFYNMYVCTYDEKNIQTINVLSTAVLPLFPEKYLF